MIVVYNCGIVILGDINIHLDVITDPATVKFTTEVNSFGLKQMVELPTHRAVHTLDIVLVNVDQSTTVSILVRSGLPPLEQLVHSILWFPRPRSGQVYTAVRC
jgi:hypothetical protein